MLSIKNLHVAINGKEILKGVNLEIRSGEVHAIMGPNGSGKTTLASVLAGRHEYEILKGEITYNGKNLLKMPPEDRAREGIFLAFQYPVEISGVSTHMFLKTAMNEKRKYHGEEPIDIMDFMELLKKKREVVKISDELLERGINDGFSGGEKKKNEIFQMAVLEPKFAILDETDSGLDIDALKMVARALNALRKKDNAFLVITHYPRILEYFIPDVVHVFSDGKIVKSGGKELALALEKGGYGNNN